MRLLLLLLLLLVHAVGDEGIGDDNTQVVLVLLPRVRLVLLPAEKDAGGEGRVGVLLLVVQQEEAVRGGGGGRARVPTVVHNAGRRHQVLTALLFLREKRLYRVAVVLVVVLLLLLLLLLPLVFCVAHACGFGRREDLLCPKRRRVVVLHTRSTSDTKKEIL